jgi:hypothetical protein
MMNISLKEWARLEQKNFWLLLHLRSRNKKKSNSSILSLKAVIMLSRASILERLSSIIGKLRNDFKKQKIANTRLDPTGNKPGRILHCAGCPGGSAASLYV